MCVILVTHVHVRRECALVYICVHSLLASQNSAPSWRRGGFSPDVCVFVRVMCVCQCESDILGGVWITAGSDFCSTQITLQLECVCFLNEPYLSCPCFLPPCLALSLPSQRHLRCCGRRRTPPSSTWQMNPLTASWRNTPLLWSCSTPHVSKKS